MSTKKGRGGGGLANEARSNPAMKDFIESRNLLECYGANYLYF